MSDDTDAGLLTRLQSDPDAVELFYLRHRARVLAYAISRRQTHSCAAFAA